jgi:hypothetical protein
MKCEKCGCALEDGNIVHSLMLPHTFRYIIEKIRIHPSGNKELMTNWELTEKYFPSQDDYESVEGKPVNKYYCRRCGKEYTKEEIIAGLMEIEDRVYQIKKYRSNE